MTFQINAGLSDGDRTCNQISVFPYSIIPPTANSLDLNAKIPQSVLSPALRGLGGEACRAFTKIRQIGRHFCLTDGWRGPYA